MDRFLGEIDTYTIMTQNVLSSVSGAAQSLNILSKYYERLSQLPAPVKLSHPAEERVPQSYQSGLQLNRFFDNRTSRTSGMLMCPKTLEESVVQRSPNYISYCSMAHTMGNIYLSMYSPKSFIKNFIPS